MIKVSATSSGVKLKLGDREIGLDTRQRCEINFISHAHSDHVSRSAKRVICSDETALLVSGRYHIEFEREMPEGFELVPSGHILGSTALLLHSDQGRLLFTGDFSPRDRLFLKGFKPPKAEILILETTFGDPRYNFPDTYEVIKESTDWVRTQLESGRSVTTLGYSLGKAQVLCSMMEKLKFPVYIHGSILKMNSIYSQLGVELRGFIPYAEARKRGYFDNGPFILVSPQKMAVDTLNAKFTGWAMTMQFDTDAAFPLSDHAGFDELMETVRKVDPSVVFTVHGFKEEFAERLRQEGRRAVSLSSHQMKLRDFV